MTAPLGWGGIARLGLVQACLGAMAVLVTSTLNRVMTVEYALPAIVPGALVALHYAVQVSRPVLGWGSDMGGRRTGWILGGVALMGAGSVAAAGATGLFPAHPAVAGLLAAASFAAVGLGVGAAGTSLLALMAALVPAERRGVAGCAVWVTMIAGIAVTAGVAGRLLDPFSPQRLVAVVAGAAVLALALVTVAVWGMEGRRPPAPLAAPRRQPFGPALREIWAEPRARRFAAFVFVSMLAYSAEELILEPCAGAVFGFTPGQSAGLTGMQHGGVLAGMLLVAAATALGGWRDGAARLWTAGGCVASALAALAVAACAAAGPGAPLREAAVALGVANGVFAVSAIAAMMGLAGQGRGAREGTRMGLWGAAQALAFGAGGLAGTAASDVARLWLADPRAAYAAVFAVEAAAFAAAAVLATRVFRPASGSIFRPAPAAAALVAE